MTSCLKHVLRAWSGARGRILGGFGGHGLPESLKGPKKEKELKGPKKKKRKGKEETEKKKEKKGKSKGGQKKEKGIGPKSI